MPKSIPSPIRNIILTKEIMDKILEMTGATCVFMAVSDEPVDHMCDPDKCTGHYVNMNTVGFKNHQILSIAANIARSFKCLVIPEEDIEEVKE